MTKESVEIPDVRDEILNYLKSDDRSLKWMHDKIKEKFGDDNRIPYATLYSCLHQKLFKVSDDNMKMINETLGTDFK